MGKIEQHLPPYWWHKTTGKVVPFPLGPIRNQGYFKVPSNRKIAQNTTGIMLQFVRAVGSPQHPEAMRVLGYYWRKSTKETLDQLDEAITRLGGME